MKFTVLFHEFTHSSVQALIKRFGMPKTVIEIGLFEGNTTFNMTHLIASRHPEYKHYAIDPYGESDDLEADAVSDAKTLFLSNLNGFQYKDNIEFINQPSNSALIDLYNKGVKADLIYIDGDHRANAVLEDLVLSYNLLNPGGILLCDDCIAWRHERLQDNPKLAVDAFISCYWDKVAVEQLPNGYQIAIRKL